MEIEASTLTEAMEVAHEAASVDPELSIERFVVSDREYLTVSDIDSSLEEVSG